MLDVSVRLNVVLSGSSQKSPRGREEKIIKILCFKNKGKALTLTNGLNVLTFYLFKRIQYMRFDVSVLCYKSLLPRHGRNIFFADINCLRNRSCNLGKLIINDI
jgi:hypothetical protein